ncbi:hypothetical protein AVEN_29453-1 [Araneus ventricosus]|uniref:Uncharacterized protein n=1 Tax=Araneus ventricosus TaxID=182803 RepID=A0A4Y2KC85_ARAVE|nr:hypothetical protein AVEN_29453-1 [Araneus ventricosus]
MTSATARPKSYIRHFTGVNFRMEQSTWGRKRNEQTLRVRSLSSADSVKEASSNSVIILVKLGPDTIHFRRPASFSKVPITPPWLSIFLLFCSWKWS